MEISTVNFPSDGQIKKLFYVCTLQWSYITWIPCGKQSRVESFGSGFSTANFLDSDFTYMRFTFLCGWVFWTDIIYNAAESNCYIFLIAVRESKSKWRRHGNTAIKYGSSIWYGSATTTTRSAAAWPTNTIGPFMWAMRQSAGTEGKPRVAPFFFFHSHPFSMACNRILFILVCSVFAQLISLVHN